MTLIPDWGKVLRKAWSVRLGILAAVLSGIEVILPLFQDTFPRGVFAVFSFAATVGSIYARAVYQKAMHDGDE